MLDTTPPKRSKKKAVVGPPKSWSKVRVLPKKKKVRSNTESEDDVGGDV